LHKFSCLICAGTTLQPKSLRCADFYLRTPFVVDYVACKSCGLVQQTPVPADTADFYPASYPMHHSRGRLFKLARKLLIRRCYFEPARADSDKVLLDFGCGDGSYLESIAGRVGRRIGFEAAPEQARQVAAWLEIAATSDPADRVAVPDASVDIVTAHFVLEHLTDLDGAFAYWRRVLKRGGRLHVGVPNIDCFEARLFGKKWHGLDAPRHISFPGGKNLAKLGRKHGFRLIRHHSGIFPNTWAGSLATIVTGKFNSKLFLLFMPLGFLLACLMPRSTAIYELVKAD
jgi:SAM-dependent methyltransferase